MPTTLPQSKDIKLKELREFDGNPAQLTFFDTNIRDTLDRWDIPAYHGGWVTGNSDDGYEFVAAATAGSVSNYRLGQKVCATITPKFRGAAEQWWNDYSSKPDYLKPNCWKVSPNPAFVPPTVVEVSLYALLAEQFDPTIDAQQAELELDGYRWHPLDKKALGVVPFRGHVSRLCTRAGKTGWALCGKAIRNTFPDWLCRKVDVTPTEEAF